MEDNKDSIKTSKPCRCLTFQMVMLLAVTSMLSLIAGYFVEKNIIVNNMFFVVVVFMPVITGVLLFHYFAIVKPIKRINNRIEKVVSGYEDEELKAFFSSEFDSVRNSVVSLEKAFVKNKSRHEKDLASSEAKYEVLFDNAADAIFIHDSHTKKILEANESAAKKLGYTKDELLSLTINDIMKPDAPGYNKKARRHIINALGGNIFETVHITKQGKEIPVSVSSVIIEFENQKVIQSFVRDITERKKAQDKLVKAKHLAETANIAKTNFLANMSHELRTPLNAINGFSEVIMTKMLGDLSDQYVDYARMINESGNHLLALISDVLDMSKIEAGEIDINETDIDVAAVVREIVDMLQTKIKENNVGIHTSFDTACRLHADEVRVKQIIINIVSNVVKFTKDGKVNISLTTEGDNFCVRVSDTGIGMDEDGLTKALETFGKVENNAMIRGIEGTGLGLSLTKQLVEIHGGTFEITSKKDVGTDVKILFPSERTRMPKFI